MFDWARQVLKMRQFETPVPTGYQEELRDKTVDPQDKTEKRELKKKNKGRKIKDGHLRSYSKRQRDTDAAVAGPMTAEVTQLVPLPPLVTSRHINGRPTRAFRC